MPPPRTLRLQEFQASLDTPQVSHELLTGAFHLLRLSLSDRSSSYRIRGNHYSSNVPGVIVLFTNAFDAWLNEQLAFAVFAGKRSSEFKKLANKPAECDKYKGLCKLAGVKALPYKANILLLTELRNEVVHFYPRLPHNSHFYRCLKRKGLIIPDPENGRLGNNHSLNNYATAYWVVRTIQDITCYLGLPLSHRLLSFDLSSNFIIPGHITPPAQLYDELPTSNG